MDSKVLETSVAANVLSGTRTLLCYMKRILCNTKKSTLLKKIDYTPAATLFLESTGVQSVLSAKKWGTDMWGLSYGELLKFKSNQKV